LRVRASSRAWVHDEKRLSGQVAMELKTCRAELATCNASLLDSNKARDELAREKTAAQADHGKKQEELAKVRC
jgi:hypothetical protein